MAKISFTRKYTKGDTTPLYAQIPISEPVKIGNKTKYNYLRYYISETINPKFWNKKTCRAKSTAKFPEYPEFNQRLDDIESMINAVLLSFKNSGSTPTKDEIKNELDKVIKQKNTATDATSLANLTLTQFTQHLIDTLPYKKSTLKSYKVVLRNLKDYEKKHKTVLTYKNADIDFYNLFVKYLTDLGLAQNTIGTRIKIIKTILNKANERGIDVSLDYQKKSFSKPKEETESIYLNETELSKMYNLSNLPKYLETVRDMFIIGSYTGLRYSDLFRLTKDNITSDNTISLKTQKTERIVDIPIHTRVKQIFEKYDYQLPKSISNQKYNEYIKEVAEKAEINEPITTQNRIKGMLVSSTTPKYKLVTSHTARRSFATNAYLADVPVLSIMEITGHKTESAFMKYIKMSSKDNAMKLKSHKFFNPLTIAK
ncbi:MAG: site-specific integrase [Bacteroidales bacterium]|nr:site-specific integrase [Bacteroidales bacterium]